MFKSATLKLTLSYLAIITALCVMFSATIYHFANNELVHGLSRQSERIATEYPGFDFNPALRPERDFSDASHHVLLNLIYFNIIVLILAGFASYGLARWTLRPIEESHEQQKRFTADVSHELRTPLTALKMTSEVALMDKGTNKTELRQALTSNLEDAGKLEALINNLLRLTRLEASEVQQHFTPQELNLLLTEVVKEVRERADIKDIRIDQDGHDNEQVVGDRTSLIQLFSIFLDNAIKYSPNGTAITIRTMHDDQTVTIEIIDQGGGISKDDLPHIFDRFYRADTARTSGEQGGAGLGLSIAKMIAELHQGSIRITSASGQGTTVAVQLPLANQT